MRLRPVISTALLLLIVARLALAFSQAPAQLTDRDRLHDIWLHSQYNLNRGYAFEGNMSDEDLRTFAALEYVRGSDPTLVNFEDPPLAKYLLGVSQVVFGNILFVQFASAALILLLTRTLGQRIRLPSPFDLIAPLLLAFDPLFIRHAARVNLDLFQLAFMLGSLVLLLSGTYSRRRLIALGVTIGAVMSAKVVITGIVFLLYVLVVLRFLRVPNYGSAAVVVAASSFSVYLLSYVVFFIHRSPWDFVTLHVSIARLYLSYLPDYPWFEIWRILFLGKWRTWFATPAIQPVEEYWLIWPASTLATLSLLVFRRYRSFPLKPEQVLLAWALVYLGFQSFHVVFPRYLIAALPLLYVLAIRASHPWAQRRVRGRSARPVKKIVGPTP